MPVACHGVHSPCDLIAPNPDQYVLTAPDLDLLRPWPPGR